MFRMLTPTEAVAMGRKRFEEAERERDWLIHQASHNPLEFGWEPPMWEVLDALGGINIYADGTGAWEEKRDLNRAYREHLGFTDPVQALLIQGGNRNGKTEWAMKRTVQVMLSHPDIAAWAFHSSEDMSKAKDSHQPLIWKYLPVHLRESHGENGIRTRTTYIKFSDKGGFTENSFILPNKSACMFKFYGQEQDRTIQGLNPYWVLMDELFPVAWIKDCMYRVAASGGLVVGMFTPKNGYTPAVGWFVEAAELMKESTAFMLPKDGGQPDVQRALGFETREEMRVALEQGEDKKRKRGYGPNSVPEQCQNWLSGKPSQPAVPEGRAFETRPRVLRCAPLYFDGRWVHNRAVVYLHSQDGPFGNPRNVIQSAVTQSRNEIDWRIYGYTTNFATALLKKFGKHHECKASEIPETGTNYHYMDPAASRNPFQTWFRVVGQDVYLYREWPGNYEIPGQGIPGAWAGPDEKRPDGIPGPAQESFGWGIKRHKQEIARLEGWSDYREDGEGVKDWSPENGTREPMYERRMDARAASNPTHENNRMTTLLTMFEDVGLEFLPCPADDIESGVEAVNDLLDWDPEEDFDISRMRLHICEECVNTITCMRMWTGRRSQQDVSGRVYQGGAAKDPIDNIRYMALSNVVDAGSEGLEPTMREFG